MSSNIKYYILDLETNGLMWKNNFHEICELSIIRAPDRVQFSRFVKVSKPENSSIDALKITGKTHQDLNKGIGKDQLINEFEKFIQEDGLTPEHRCLVGHNIINFDRRFLWQLWETRNKKFPFSLFLDTIHLTRDYSKRNQIIKPKVNLHAACDMVGIKKFSEKHTAISDSRNTYMLWQRLMEITDYIQHIKRFNQGDEGEE